MLPQYLAGRSLDPLNCEAFEPQNHVCAHVRYCPAKLWAMLGVDCTQAIGTSERGRTGPKAHVGSVECDRRIRCPRASKCLQCLVCLVSPRAASRKKSSLSSIRSRSRPSPSTPASTSKTVGRAPGPAHPQALRSQGLVDRDHGSQSRHCCCSTHRVAVFQAPLKQAEERDCHPMPDSLRSLQWRRWVWTVIRPSRSRVQHSRPITALAARSARQGCARPAVSARLPSQPPLPWVTAAARSLKPKTKIRPEATPRPAIRTAEPSRLPLGGPDQMASRDTIADQPYGCTLRLARATC